MFDILMIFLFTFFLFNSIFIITSTNSIHSVLFLVLNFALSTGILLVLEREFLALSFIIIYVGAISVLFLFVIMMLDIKILHNRKDLFRYFPIGIFFGLIFFFEVFYVIINIFYTNSYNSNLLKNFYVNWFKKVDSLTDIIALGQIIYTHYVIQFLLAGIILLLAVLSSVVLTKDHLLINKQKNQIIFKQISRHYKSSVLN